MVHVTRYTTTRTATWFEPQKTKDNNKIIPCSVVSASERVGLGDSEAAIMTCQFRSAAVVEAATTP